MFKIFYEDMTVGDEQTFGATVVDKDEVIEFASRYDPQPFHLNEEIAKMSVFGKLCASGWHTCAMTMRMMVDKLMADGVAGMGSPGVKDIAWPKPVFPGDTLTVFMKITEKRTSKSRPNIGLVTFESTVKTDRDTVAMTMAGTMMILRRSPGADDDA